MIMKTQTNNKLPSRESETREKVSRRKPWAPPSQLDAPPAPAGFVHRWIRAESVGQMDQLTQDKDDAIANDPLKDQHPSMPISNERSSRVTFGGKKPN